MGFSKEFIKCVDLYTKSGYMSCNALLRNSNSSHGLTKGKVKHNHRIIDAFDAEMPALKKNYTLYRGLQFESWSVLPKKLDFRKQKNFAFPGFLSTSLERWVAEQRAFIPGIGRQVAGVLYELKVKKGTRGVIVNDLVSNEQSYENEVILYRGLKFKLVSAKEYDPHELSEIDEPDEFDAAWIVKLKQV